MCLTGIEYDDGKIIYFCFKEFARMASILRKLLRIICTGCLRKMYTRFIIQLFLNKNTNKEHFCFLSSLISINVRNDLL